MAKWMKKNLTKIFKFIIFAIVLAVLCGEYNKLQAV